MKKTIIFVTAAILLASCGKKVLIDDSRTFANNCWIRLEPVEFQVPVDNIDKGYNVCVTLRYDTTRYSETTLPLVVDYFPDSSELHNFFPSIRLRDKKGALLGKRIGQYCEVTDTIDRGRHFNRKGVYTYRIKQGTYKYDLYGMVGFGLRIVDEK